MRPSWVLAIAILLACSVVRGHRREWRPSEKDGKAAHVLEGGRYLDVLAGAPEGGPAGAVPAGEAALDKEDGEATDPAEILPRNAESARLPVPLMWLLRHRNADGSWGGHPEYFEGTWYTKFGATSLALLAFFVTGYTDLTTYVVRLNPESDEIVDVRQAIKDGLRWLANNKPETANDTALTSWAWSAIHETTRSRQFREHARRHLKALLDLQSVDGSWGGDGQTSSWAALALHSAEEGGLEVPDAARKAAAAWFAARLKSDPKPEYAVAWIYLSHESSRAALWDIQEALAMRPPHASQENFGYWYHGSVAMLLLDGWGHKQFTAWKGAQARALETLKDPREAWARGQSARSASPASRAAMQSRWARGDSGTADVVRNSIGHMAESVYLRY